MNINWVTDRKGSGYVINLGGEVTGSGGSISIDTPRNIKLVIAAKGSDAIDGYTTLFPSQRAALREIIKKLPPDTKFTSDSEFLFELAVNMLEMNK